MGVYIAEPDEAEDNEKAPGTMLQHRSRGTPNKAHTVYHEFCFTARKDLMMEKFSLVEIAKTIADKSGDESDMVFIVRNNGDRFTAGA